MNYQGDLVERVAKGFARWNSLIEFASVISPPTHCGSGVQPTVSVARPRANEPQQQGGCDRGDVCDAPNDSKHGQPFDTP